MKRKNYLHLDGVSNKHSKVPNGDKIWEWKEEGRKEIKWNEVKGKGKVWEGI